MDEELIKLKEQGWRALSSGTHAATAFYGPLLTEDSVMIF